MRVVGLTGNVASGKSAVARFWREAGIPVASADEFAREAVAPGTEGLDRVVDTFGDGVLASDGTLDRAALRDRVFRDEDARRRLEAIVHPRVREARDRWLAGRRREEDAVVVVEIPLLFEVGMDAEVDETVVVHAQRDRRLERLVRDRGLAADEAERIMAAQADPESKRARADHVVENDGSLDELRRGASAVLARIVGEAGVDLRVSTPDYDEGPPAGWMRVDLHLHTRASWDCLSDPEALLARARERGVTRLAFTDHDTLPAALELARRYPDSVIAGEEVKTAEGIDMIGLYLEREIPRGTPAREVIRQVREQGGIVYLPHPFAKGKGGGGRLAEELAPLVDVVEIFNGRLHPGRLNEPALSLARRHGRLAGAGSDAHTVGEVGGSYVELPIHPSEPHALRQALRHGRPAGRTVSNLVHLASTWAKVRKKLPL